MAPWYVLQRHLVFRAHILLAL